MSVQRQIAIPKRLAKLLKKQGEARLISRSDADKCAVIVREMLKHINRRDTFKSWVNFSRDKFFELIGKRTYVRVLDYLEQSKVIYRTSSYYAGNGEDLGVEPFTKAVCIDEKYRSHSNCVFWNLSTKHSINSVEKTFKIKTRTSTAKALTEMFGEFQLNVSSDDAANLSDGYAWSLENVRSIQSQRYFVTEDRFSGRIHSSFTQLSGVFSAYIRKDNYRVIRGISYLEKDGEVKLMNVADHAEIGDYWIGTETQMLTQKNGKTVHRTLMKIDNIEVDFEVDDSEFTLNRLEQGL